MNGFLKSYISYIEIICIISLYVSIYLLRLNRMQVIKLTRYVFVFCDMFWFCIEVIFKLSIYVFLFIRCSGIHHSWNFNGVGSKYDTISSVCGYYRDQKWNQVDIHKKIILVCDLFHLLIKKVWNRGKRE